MMTKSIRNILLKRNYKLVLETSVIEMVENIWVFGNEHLKPRDCTFTHCFTFQKELILQANLCNVCEAETLCKNVIKKYGGVDVLVNNAAMVIDASLEERTVEIFEQTLRCNLVAPFVLSKELGLVMNKRKKGNIINISSTNGIDYNSPYSLDYDASKAGLISLTKNLAMLLQNVNVNCVAPHWMNTQMNVDLEEDFLKEEAAKILKGRFAETDEVAELVWFLISDKAKYLTGQIYSFGSYKY